MTAIDARDAAGLVGQLIETCERGAHDFLSAAARVGDPRLRRLLETYAAQRFGFARELRGEPPAQSEAGSAGADPWQPSRPDDEPAILAACARRDQAAVEAYETARSTAATGLAGAAIGRQYQLVREASAHLRSLVEVLPSEADVTVSPTRPLA